MSTEHHQQPAFLDFAFHALREAGNYQRLLANELGASLRGRTIEVGAGIGHMTARLRALPGIEYLHSIEPKPAFCEEFRRMFPEQPLLQGTMQDMPRDDWDSIVSINVLEHIENDRSELALYHRNLRAKRGVLALFVPARPELYSQIDRDFGHCRRYTRGEVVEKLIDAGFCVEKIRYFDFTGYFGWLICCRLLGFRNFKPGWVRCFDKLIFPFEHFLETKILPPPIGKNLLVVARAQTHG